MLKSGGKYLVTYMEPGHLFADGFYFPGELHAIDRLYWICEAERNPSGEPEQGRDGNASHSEVTGGGGGRVHFDQDFLVLWRWCFDLFEFEDFRSAVFACYDGYHFGT